MSTQASDWLGQTVGEGRYLVVRCLREGGTTHVFLGQDQTSGESVIVKVPNAEQVQADEKFRQRCLREINALKRLAHPNVVRILCSGEESGLPFVVLRFLEGGTLAKRMYTGPGGRAEAQSAEAMLTWLPMVGQALDFIHSQNYVHRDIKPDNILFDGAGKPAIGDLGFARIISTQDAGSTLSPVGSRPGTPPYMAPEQIVRQRLGPWTDQFALAVVVYEWLTGRRPFAGETHEDIAKSHRESPPSLRTILPDLPEGVSQAVSRALSVQSTNRFGSCRDFVSAVIAALGPRGPVGPAASLTKIETNLDSWSLPISEFEPASPAQAIQPIENLVAPVVEKHIPAPLAQSDPRATVIPVVTRGTRPSFAGGVLRCVAVIVLTVVAAFAGSFFLPGTMPQRWFGQPIAGLLESLGAPGWKNTPNFTGVTSPEENPAQPKAENEGPVAEKSDQSKRIEEMTAELDTAKEALRRAEKDKEEYTRQLTGAKNLLADESVLRKAAEEKREEILKLVAKAEDEVRDAKAKAATANDNLKQLRGANDELREKIAGIEKTAKNRKLAFIMKNTTVASVPFEIRWLTWTGEWTSWQKEKVEKKGRIKVQSTLGCVALQVRYNRLPGEEKVEDINAQSFHSSTEKDSEDVDSWYVFEGTKNRKEIRLIWQVRK